MSYLNNNIGYQSYKNRSIDFNKQVKIYKNLHNGLFSVMQDNLVVAHIECFEMLSVVFKVNESGRQRILKEQKKNVHAFIIGILSSVNNHKAKHQNDCGITYNPYKYDCFVWMDNERKVELYPTEYICGCNKQGIFKRESF